MSASRSSAVPSSLACLDGAGSRRRPVHMILRSGRTAMPVPAEPPRPGPVFPTLVVRD
ncbi:hypothetical protein F750_6872 [Streptomyces sp. PAMC 26508]|nr:hypothetical protein F750_6872 [Streptomyces sp. PAMC 26508]